MYSPRDDFNSHRCFYQDTVIVEERRQAEGHDVTLLVAWIARYAIHVSGQSHEVSSSERGDESPFSSWAEPSKKKLSLDSFATLFV